MKPLWKTAISAAIIQWREKKKNREGRFVALKGNKPKCAYTDFHEITRCFLATFKFSFINNSGKAKYHISGASGPQRKK